MNKSDIFREKLEQSRVLYQQFLDMSRDMDANLARWDAAKISDYLLEARKLQNRIHVLDREIVSLQDMISVSAACRELLQERKGIVRDILSILEKNKTVISRMLTMLTDDIAKSKSFRNAAGGYFKKSRRAGRTFEQTV